MVDIRKRLNLTSDAAGDLIKYIEELVGDTWIEIDLKHVPVRKALHLTAGPESGWGARIPFSVYKEVIDKVQRDNTKLEKRKQASVDAENEFFEDEVNSLEGGGVSASSAIEIVAGVGNLDMLAEGMVEGFIHMIESILPADVIPEQFKAVVPNVREFMNQGINSTPPEVADFLDKLSPAWKYFRSKEQKTAHHRVLSYAYAYAVNNSGTDPAKLWEAWAMYPTLKNIKLSADIYLLSVPKDTPRFTSTFTARYVSTQSDMWDLYIRRAAVLFSNQLSQSLLCCVSGVLINLETARSFIARIRAMLEVTQQFNMNDMKLGSLNTRRFSQAAQQSLGGAIMSSMNENFEKQVTHLRELWLDFTEKSDGTECIPLTQLFDGLVGILGDMKNRIALRIRSLVNWGDSHWGLEGSMQLTMMEQNSYASYLRLLNTVERILALEARCPIDGSSNDSRAVDIINKLRFDGGGFNGHVKGTPLPEGMDPDSPLANLEPVITKHGLTIEPGIQGSDLPNQELEELFSQCRRGNFGAAGTFQTLPGIFRRR